MTYESIDIVAKLSVEEEDWSIDWACAVERSAQQVAKWRDALVTELERLANRWPDHAVAYGHAARLVRGER